MRKKAIIILGLLILFLLLYGSVQFIRQGWEFSCNNLTGANELLAYASPSSNPICVESIGTLSNHNLNANVSLHISHFDRDMSFYRISLIKPREKAGLTP